jgi:hypothetical protein
LGVARSPRRVSPRPISQSTSRPCRRYPSNPRAAGSARPPGVWIIDAKKYKGRLQRRDKGGWRTIDYHVYVNGRDQTKLARGLHKQAAVVRTALSDLDVPIHSVLCFIEAEWDFFLKPFQVDGVWVTYGKHLAEMIGAGGPRGDDEVLRVTNVLAATLPPMVR